MRQPTPAPAKRTYRAIAAGTLGLVGIANLLAGVAWLTANPEDSWLLWGFWGIGSSIPVMLVAAGDRPWVAFILGGCCLWLGWRVWRRSGWALVVGAALVFLNLIWGIVTTLTRASGESAVFVPLWVGVRLVSLLLVLAGFEGLATGAEGDRSIVQQIGRGFVWACVALFDPISAFFALFSRR
ncbi:MAG: hypothetical protein Fur0046_13740 [Cyanobacteria bacterium J069]|nr:MAG: hypothetical protein D6742_15000 [Cyanobacteria bacterium J069]